MPNLALNAEIQVFAQYSLEVLAQIMFQQCPEKKKFARMQRRTRAGSYCAVKAHASFHKISPTHESNGRRKKNKTKTAAPCCGCMLWNQNETFSRKRDFQWNLKSLTSTMRAIVARSGCTRDAWRSAALHGKRRDSARVH